LTGGENSELPHPAANGSSVRLSLDSLALFAFSSIALAINPSPEFLGLRFESALFFCFLDLLSAK
jgi:hypothetical protein